MLKIILVMALACVSVLAQVNLKVTSSELPLSVGQAVALGFSRSLVLILRAGGLSGLSLLLSWYTYKYFGFLELLIASSITYVLATAVSYWGFHEPLGWNRLVSVVLITAGVSLSFVSAK